MRLGLYPARLAPGSKAAAAYGAGGHTSGTATASSSTTAIARRSAAGMMLSGQSPDGRLVEIVELDDHPWFVASQFHPEFKSRPDRPHPLFDGFVAASIAVAAGREPEFRRAARRAAPRGRGRGSRVRRLRDAGTADRRDARPPPA